MKLNFNSIELDVIDTKDYPDFSDAFTTYAEWENGIALTDAELDELDSSIIYEKVLLTIY